MQDSEQHHLPDLRVVSLSERQIRCTRLTLTQAAVKSRDATAEF